ncbi:MAG: hypothetical protein Q7T93_04305 [Methylobacterium sp.]|uniref:hypothetical protein n=1 Tax=Methylobacterium sp. TaxID=409 RepID=UPI0027230A32|nr:hypothetical protein [Methylobacterium sp.]MDO9426032.1 hypothetical protein [Methylobacterium sp.]
MKSPLPKLAADFKALVGIARKESSPVVIEAALADARAQVVTATAEREAAEAAYRDGLLDASPAESERHLAEKASATVRLDRSEHLVAALTQRLAMARNAEAHATRKAIHDDAVAKCEAIKARLPAEYRHHAGALRSLIRDLAEAEVARERAAKEAPDFPAISSPEDDVRGGNGVPEEIISQETVRLWVIDGRTDPMPKEAQGQVRHQPNAPGRGYWTPPPGGSLATGGNGITCTLRTFTRTKYRPGVNGVALDRLYAYVSLPPLNHYGDAYCTPEPYRGADTALAHLSGELRPDPKIERWVTERFEMVPMVPRRDDNVTALRGAA